MNKHTSGNCPYCGSPVAEGAEFCGYCGNHLRPEAEAFRQNRNQYNSVPTPQSPQPPQYYYAADNMAYPTSRSTENTDLSAFLIILGSLMLLGSIAMTAFFILRNLAPTGSPLSADVSSRDLIIWQDDSLENPGSEPAAPSFHIETPPSRIYPNISMEKIRSVESSPSLEENGIVHGPEHAFDKDMTTAWNEGFEGSGEGSYITFFMEETCTLRGMTIYSGFQLPERLFRMNARPREILLVFSDGSSETYTLADVTGPQTILLPTPRNTDSITLLVTSVYPGSDYDDLCITEIEFF